MRAGVIKRQGERRSATVQDAPVSRQAAHIGPRPLLFFVADL